MNKLKDNIIKFHIFLFPLIAIYLYTRVDYLGETPYYVHIDELRAAFRSMSLAGFGFSAASSDLTLYELLGAIIFKLKGGLFSLKLFRLIAVMGGLFGMVFAYLTVLETSGSKKYAFLEALLVTSLPVFFITQRSGVPAFLTLSVVPSAYYFLVKVFGEGKRRFLYLVLSILLWAVAVFGCMPSFGSLGLSFSNIPANIVNIKQLLWDDLHPYNSISMFGSIYVLSIPPLVVGIAISLRKAFMAIRSKAFDPSVVLWIFVIVSLLFDLMVSGPDIGTGCGLFFAATLLITEGLIFIADNFKWGFAVEIVLYLAMLGILSYYYYVNHNSALNNSSDHEAGIVIDKSAGEAVKASIKLFPDKKMCVISDPFEGRNLLIALYGGASPEEYASFEGADSFSFGNIEVNSDAVVDTGSDTVYVINEMEHRDIIDALIGEGYGAVYVKEFTVCYRQ